MTTIEKFLLKLSNHQIQLWVEEDKLRYCAPKNSITPELLAEMKGRKGELLTFLSARQVSSNSIKPVSRKEIIPLSFTQQRLWFLEQLEENTAIHNISFTLRLEGDLNIKILEKTFLTIIKRHEILRTSFQSKNGNPYQQIEEVTSFNLALIDLTNIPESKQYQEVEKWSKKEASTNILLTESPLVKIKLLKLSPRIHILITTIHHIIYDGWSHKVFNQELSTLYNAYLKGEENPLPDLPIQFADFAFWQQKHLQGQTLNYHLNYWQNQLKNAPSLLELPTDFPRPPQQSYQGKTLPFEISTDLTIKLKQLSQRLNVTLFMTVLAGFAILLNRYSQQKDLLIGTPIANRTLTELEPLIGFFANTLVLRIKTEDDLSFVELLEQVKNTTLDAYTYQDIPFEKLVEVLQIERSLAYNPLFQVVFAWHNTPKESLIMEGINIDYLKYEKETTQFDLDFNFREKEDKIIVYVKYNTSLFKAERISRMLSNFQTLLEAIASNPQEKISQFPLLSEAEKKQLLIDFNKKENTVSTNQCIQELFERQVKLTPNKIAVVCEKEKLTYYQLNEKANQVAHYLQELGVKPQDLIGIYFEKSLLMIIALWGILKAGATYVPLETSYPQDRIAFMLEDAEVSVLLTQENLTAKLPQNNAKIVFLDKDWNLIKNQSINNLIIENNPDNLAYIIYTSGSTGKPKGVMISHESLVSFTQTVITEYPVRREDRILQFASVSFDTAVEEIYPCLCIGATLILRTEKWLTSISGFVEYCQQFKITILDLPTAYWHQMVADLNHNNWQFPSSLRLIIIGGEKAQPEYVKMWQKKVNNYPQLMNTYGPTETTVVATKHLLQNDDLDNTLPIGKSLSYVEKYVLDNNLQLVPIGIEGELYLGGKGLAKGYLNKPELTKEKFINNPFNHDTKLYKTGDKVRYLSDGNLEFIGRIDNQVKIRGFRIELGEIETIIMQYPNVQQALVIPVNKNGQDKVLIAYVIWENQQKMLSDLESFLKENLPLYMIPSFFVDLDSFPLTSNGKVDYSKLPQPNFNSISSSKEFVLPRNNLESQLLTIWQNTLAIENISVKDNFFTLGGHSLLAVKLMSAIENKLDISLPISVIFKAGNIEDLAEEITRIKVSSQEKNQFNSLVLIKKETSKNFSPLFLIHPIGGEVFCYNDLVSRLNTSRACYGLSYYNQGKKIKYKGIKDLASNYLTEIMAVQSVGTYVLGGWSYGGLIAYEMAQQLQLKEKNADLLILIEPTIPFKNKKIKENLFLQDFAINVSLNKELAINWNFEEKLSTIDKLNLILEHLKKESILPKEYKLSQFQEKFEIFKHNVNAIANYQVKPLKTDVVLFKSEYYSENKVNFWQSNIEGNLEIHEIQGNHFTIMSKPNIQVLTQKLERKL